MSISLEMGLTNRCNCNCLHCYSKGSRNGSNQDLDYDTIVKFCNKFNIDSVNFGTDKSYLYTRFVNIMSYFYNQLNQMAT